MKKAVLVLCGIVLLWSVSAAAFAEMPYDLYWGMDHQAVLAALTSEGIVPDHDSEEKIIFSGDLCSGYITFSPENGLADWIQLNAAGEGYLDMDFTVPDWQLSCAALISRLTEAQSPYDLYLDEEGAAVYFDALIFGAEAYLCAYFSTEDVLEQIEVELWDADVSPILWAARMGAALGAPDAADGVFEERSGIEHDLWDALGWTRNGCRYEMENRISVICLETENGPDSAYEITPVIRVMQEGF